MFGESAYTPEAMRVAETTPQLVKAVRRYAAHATEQTNPQQSLMLGPQLTPEAAFEEAFPPMQQKAAVHRPGKPSEVGLPLE